MTVLVSALAGSLVLAGEFPFELPEMPQPSPSPTPIILRRAPAPKMAPKLAPEPAPATDSSEEEGERTAADERSGEIVVFQAALLGADRDAATMAVEKVSLLGGEDALVAIAGFLERWSGDREMHRRGLSALRRLPIEPTELVNVLEKSEVPAQRAWAAWTAGQQEIAAAADALLKRLDDPEAVVRARVVASLGYLGDPRANDPLLRIAVHDSDPTTRQLAADAMVVLATPRREKKPLGPILAGLRSPDVIDRLEAAEDLKSLNDHRAIGPLLEALGEERDLAVRKLLIARLAELDDEIAVPALIEVARRDAPNVRPFAIAALATLDDSRAVAPLVELSRDPDDDIRKFSVRALAFLDRPEGYDAILAALSDLVTDVRAEAAKALDRVAAGGRREQVAGLAADRAEIEPDPSVRQFLVSIVGTLAEPGDPRIEKVLVRGLEDPDPGVRRASAAALGRIGGATAEEPLLRAVQQETKKRKGKRDQELIRLAEDAARQVKAR